MMTYRLLLAFSLFFLASPGNSARAESRGKTIIVLDASGSMWGQIGGKPKIEIARDVIADLMGSLDPELEIGLMAYGHREKGNCADIELLVPPSGGDRSVFLEKVNAIIPKGMTPLTDAVEKAAGILKYEEQTANVILISDGLETCDRDPCALARELEKKGIQFTTHLVAFDLTSEESESVRCLADETGGRFLQAQDASTLKDALEMAVEALQETSAGMPELKKAPATITAPATVPAGSEFEVEWVGPDNRGDYLTIVAKGTEDRRYGNYAYTRTGSPVTLTAPVEPGPCEVRYVLPGEGGVLGRVDIEVVAVEATLDAAPEVVAGSPLEIAWTGPANRGDYVTIVPKGAEPGSYEAYAYTREGSPLKVRALPQEGPAEIRYVTGQGGKTLATRDVLVKQADVLVSGPERIGGGAPLTVDWVGPGNRGDYVTIVKKDAAEGSYNSYAYTANSKDGKVTITAEESPGDDYEVRYVEGQEKKTLARYPVTIDPVAASVSGPESAVAGSSVEIEWIGPKHRGWFITITRPDDEEGSYSKYFYTANEESPTLLQAPELEGPCEIRFVSDKGAVYARAPLTMLAASATFTDVPEKVAANGKFQVKWEGPDNRGDWVTIVPVGAGDSDYLSYVYVQNGQDQDLTAPEEPGEYEIRYVTSQEKTVLAREKIEVVAE